MRLTVEEGQDRDRTCVAACRAELDLYYDEIVKYQNMEPDQVLLSVSGLTARLIAIRADLLRSGSVRANRLRTTEVDPLLDHLELQHKIHSRLIATRQLDWDMSKGQG